MNIQELKQKLDNISRVLKEIQDKFPKDLIKKAYVEKKISPAVEKVVDLAITDPNFDPKKKEELKLQKELGLFSKTKLVPVKKYEKMINNYFSREVNEAIKKGRLPPRNKANKWRKEYEEFIKNQKTIT